MTEEIHLKMGKEKWRETFKSTLNFPVFQTIKIVFFVKEYNLKIRLELKEKFCFPYMLPPYFTILLCYHKL